MEDVNPSSLHGLRVIELGADISVGYCAKLLADLGADVYKIEAPAGDPLRRTGPVDPTGDEPASGLFHYLNANKRSVLADLDDPETRARLRELAAGAGVVIESLGPGRMESLGLGPDDLRSANPRLGYVRISNYGQTGPWRDRVSSGLVLQGETGMALRLGEPGSGPVSITGRLDEYIAGTFAASAALAAVARAERTGEGAVADVSRFETLLYSLSPVDVVEEFLTGHGLAMADRQRVMPGFVPCSDGTVCISTLTAQNWRDLCQLIGADGWLDRMQDVQNDGPARSSFLETLAGWTRERRVSEVIETMQACRIAAATAADGRTMLDQPPFRDRGFFVLQPGATFVRPAAPYRLSGTPVTLRTGAPRLGQTTLAPARGPSRDGPHRNGVAGGDPGGLPLAGLRVVDLTAFLAGGHLGEALAALGAEVIKVESPRHPDGYRFVATFPELGSRWWEQSPLWQAQNLGKKSLGLDLSADEGRDLLAELIATADVVAENFTPRVLDGFGFAYERVRAINPRIVMVRMPAFGLDGPWRDHVGFAYNIEQISGMAQSGWDGGPAVQPAGIVDIVNGQHALVATLAALRARESSGTGQLIEVAQAETVACLTADQVIEYQLTGRCRERIGNRSAECAPQGIYPCRHDRWVAVTIATDEHWRAFCGEIGMPASISDLPLERRRQLHDELDTLIADRTRERLASDIAEKLQSADVPAGVPGDASRDPGEPASGRALLTTTASRIRTRARGGLRASPCSSASASSPKVRHPRSDSTTKRSSELSESMPNVSTSFAVAAWSGSASRHDATPSAT